MVRAGEVQQAKCLYSSYCSAEARFIPRLFWISGATLLPIIEHKVIPDSIVYSDCCQDYNALDVSGFKYYRINHSKLFANGKNHINGIESFWNQAKRHTRKFNGLHKAHFGLFLKECEWPFNSPSSQAQLKQFKQWFKMYIGWLSRTAPNIFLIHLPTDIFEG